MNSKPDVAAGIQRLLVVQKTKPWKTEPNGLPISSTTEPTGYLRQTDTAKADARTHCKTLNNFYLSAVHNCKANPSPTLTYKHKQYSSLCPERGCHPETQISIENRSHTPGCRCRLGKHTAAAYLLVDAEAQGGLGYVEHDTSAAVVVLEGHSLVDGRVALDVHVVSPLQAQVRLRCRGSVKRGLRRTPWRGFRLLMFSHLGLGVRAWSTINTYMRCTHDVGRGSSVTCSKD